MNDTLDNQFLSQDTIENHPKAARPLLIAVAASLCLLLAPGPLLAEGAVESSAADSSPKYKKYTRARNSVKYQKALKITAIDNSLTFAAFDPGSGRVIASAEMPLDELAGGKSGVSIDADGIELLNNRIEFNEIRKITDTVYRSKKHRKKVVVEITLWTTSDAARVNRLSSPDRFVAGEGFHAAPGSFIRGYVLSFGGDVKIDGEINHSVITFGADIVAGPKSVIRDHAIAIGGEVILESGARVYGHILTKTGPRRLARRERPWKVEKQTLSFTPSFAYNRVDGFAPRVGWTFSDADSALPTMRLTYGFGGTSERQRARFSIKQPLIGRGKVSLVGAAYKELKSDDDELIPEWQNTLLALLATTDYKNYYEAEGGEIGLSYSPRRKFDMSLSFFSDKMRALPSTPKLWSLFGGEKDFARNFQGLSVADSESAAREINNRRVAGIKISADLSAKHSLVEKRADWETHLDLEKALDNLDSDFEFFRWELSGLLSYNFTRYTVGQIRARFGGSSGNLPIARSFFLGGYRWLRGFEHKEFHGGEFWAATLDYGVSLSGAGLESARFWMFYDVAQITPLGSSGAPLYQSLGLGLGIDSFLRLNVARRLDISGPDLRVSIEF